MKTYYLAALREGPHLIYISEDGRMFPMWAFRYTKTAPQRYHYPWSAIEVASIIAERLGCGWRVEQKHA